MFFSRSALPPLTSFFNSVPTILATQMVMLDWPHDWPDFLDVFLQSAQTSPTHCENALVVLRMLAEELDYEERQVSRSKVGVLERQLVRSSSPFFPHALAHAFIFSLFRAQKCTRSSLSSKRLCNRSTSFSLVKICTSFPPPCPSLRPYTPPYHLPAFSALPFPISSSKWVAHFSLQLVLTCPPAVLALSGASTTGHDRYRRRSRFIRRRRCADERLRLLGSGGARSLQSISFRCAFPSTFSPETSLTVVLPQRTSRATTDGGTALERALHCPSLSYSLTCLSRFFLFLRPADPASLLHSLVIPVTQVEATTRMRQLSTYAIELLVEIAVREDEHVVEICFEYVRLSKPSFLLPTYLLLFSYWLSNNSLVPDPSVLGGLAAENACTSGIRRVLVEIMPPPTQVCPPPFPVRRF